MGDGGGSSLVALFMVVDAVHRRLVGGSDPLVGPERAAQDLLLIGRVWLPPPLALAPPTIVRGCQWSGCAAGVVAVVGGSKE